MKICIISLGSYPLFNPTCTRTFGGSEVQLFVLAQELAKNPNIDLHFIVGDFGQEKVEKYGRITVYKGIPVKRHSKVARFLPRSKVLLFNLMRKIQADIYIQRSASAGTGLIALLAHFWRKKFVYMTAHEIDCNGGFEQQNSWLAGKLFQFGIRSADLVVTQSQEHAQMITAHHRRSSIVIPSLYAIAPESAFEHIEKTYTLWVGRCEDWKRPEIFIELAHRHPEQEFVMISPESNNQSDYYIEIKKQLEHAPKNLRHVTYVPFAEIDEYFKHAKLFINTSSYEGFPNTFVQAMKNQTPILSLVVNPDQMLEHAGCGASAHNDTEQFYALAKKYLSTPALLSKCGQAGYRYAKEIHDSHKITQQYTELFEDLIQKR
ncbi:MAG: glycosyltransferase family 4 protein [Candidatus Kerfeldbacteria bacterium]|nr:glycosyltransferase family 4 protein [Candidatus Kerfeldbacteria bacterium]